MNFSQEKAFQKLTHNLFILSSFMLRKMFIKHSVNGGGISVISYQLSVISYQLLVISYQLSVPTTKASGARKSAH
ncbi:MAG: hypothetical protein F6K17_39055 [Okeania sp. SIO3C4]|nr:hypothetical protein [Okeania sp. SIO3C4]